MASKELLRDIGVFVDELKLEIHTEQQRKLRPTRWHLEDGSMCHQSACGSRNEWHDVSWQS